MSFLGWTFLFGALAVAGPIAAHLLSKPRFRKVPFTMLRFLRSGQRESHARRHLRDLLVLLLRCAAMVLIALLFARPVLHVTPEPKESRSVHYLALDDSMSMAYRDGNRTLFERLTDAALERVRRAPDDSVFNLCALASGRSVFDLSKGQAIAEIKRLKPVPRSASLEGFFTALRQAGQTVSQSDTLSGAVLSDFSPSVLAQLEQVPQPALVDDVQHESVFAVEPIDNAAIVAVRLADVVDSQILLDVVVANYGGREQQRTLAAQVLHLESAVLELKLAAQQRGTFRVQVSPGPRLSRAAQAHWPIELSLSPHDGLAEDDSYRVAAYLPPTEPIDLLLVHRDDQTFLFETAIEALSKASHLDEVEIRKVTQDRLTTTDLAWANVTVLSSLPDSPACSPADIERYLRAGGKLICFAQQAQSSEAARRLWQAGLLAALPDKWIDEVAYLEAQPYTRDWFDLDDRAVQSLVGYRLDKIAVKGAWQCRTDPDAQCVWRFANGAGFIYGKSLDRGQSVFVNTSIDDSLGLLAKSRAWVAFCRYLLSKSDQMRLFCFSTAERPALRTAGAASTFGERIAVQDCDGQRTAARFEGATLRFPAPAGIGWMKTLDEPELYAPINLPDGETDLSVPTAEAVAAAVQRTFVIDKDRRQAVAQASVKIERKPIWQFFAWATIALLLVESALANRLKR
ncbi:MAG: BatA domain-containing protein [Sedimentisphaerales bacterium]|nr:BatA domain-containing protein [Sedimentisphaerales bacterium]